MSAITPKQASIAAADQACRLLELPEELLRRVLVYLCPASLQFAGSTCGQLRRATAAPGLAEAVVRGSGAFWAPLAYDQPVRSLIDHLLPNGLAGPSLAGLRRYFSGTQPAAAPACGDDLFLYGTLERGGEVVATYGPVDARAAVRPLLSGHNYWLVAMRLDWKSPDLQKKCSQLFGDISANVYVLTRQGAYVVYREAVPAGFDLPLYWSDLGFHVLNGVKEVQLTIPIVEISSGTDLGHATALQLVHLLRPTARDVNCVD